MKELAREMKDGGQSAIIVLECDGDEGAFRGYISFRNGEIVEALYKENPKDGSWHSKSGREALKRVWKEALNQSAKVKVYSLGTDGEDNGGSQATESMQSGFAQKKMKKLQKEDTEDPAVAQVRAWRDEGYSVDDLIDKFAAGEQTALRTYMEYDAKIKRLKNLENALDGLQGKGFDQDYARLSSIVKDPRKVAELELGVGLLKRKVESRKHSQQPGQLVAITQTASDYDDVFSVVFGSDRMRPPDGRCPNCGAKMTLTVCDICGFVIGQETGPGPGLNPSMNFGNFVVGASNKFAYAACVSIANASPDQYNPLYVYSAPGLGKTHLLNAVGNHLRSERKNTSVLYLGTDRFVDELSGSKREKADGYIASLRKLDVLLLDDIQLIAGKEEAQNQLLALVNSMLSEGKNVLVSGDRPPKDVRGLDMQLTSRFESGLMVDMRPPDPDMRMKILEMKVREEKYQMPQTVLKYIAETVDDNIRELTGSLNRVIAYSTLMKLPPTVESAKRILRTNQLEQRKESRGRIELRPGHGYIIEEDRASMCHILVQEKLQENWTALDISRVNPSRLRAKFPGLEKARVVWLTDRESDREITLQPSLEKIEYEIKGFMESASRGSGNAIVNIDDLQYVVSNTNFEGTVRLLRRMVDEMSERNSVLIISVGKETLAKQEIAILERELELIQ